MRPFPACTTKTRPPFVLAIPPKHLTPPRPISMLPLSLQHLHTSKGFHRCTSTGRDGLEGEDLPARLLLVGRGGKGGGGGGGRAEGKGEGDGGLAGVGLTSVVGGRRGRASSGLGCSGG